MVVPCSGMAVAVAVPPTSLIPTMLKIAAGLVTRAVTVTLPPLTATSPVTPAAASTSAGGGPGRRRVGGQPGRRRGPQRRLVQGVGARPRRLLGDVGGPAVRGQRRTAVQHQTGQREDRDGGDQQVGGDRTPVVVIAAAAPPPGRQPSHAAPQAVPAARCPGHGSVHRSSAGGAELPVCLQRRPAGGGHGHRPGQPGQRQAGQIRRAGQGDPDGAARPEVAGCRR